MSFYSLWDWIHDRQVVVAEKQYEPQSREKPKKIVQPRAKGSVVKKTAKIPRKRKPSIRPTSDWLK